MRVATAAEMAAIDRRTIEERGLPGAVLMETAGRAVAHAILSRWPEARRFLVLCGPGNNGGDGFVAARTLQRHGREVRVCLLGSPDRLKGDAALHARVFGGPLEPVPARLPAADVRLDALFGTGLARPLEGAAAAAAEALNGSPGATVAVDVPSGICSDTGRVLGAAVRADLTVTMGWPKPGLLLHPGAAHAGEVRVAEIGFPAEELARTSGEVLTADLVRRMLPERPPTAHKGSCGAVLLVGGSERYTGAPALAAEGALRAGAGLLFLACPRAVHPLLASYLREAIYLPLPSPSGGLEPGDLEALLPVPERARAMCLGPGLGGESASHEAVRAILAKTELPVVIDADALRAVAGTGPLRPGAVLTPHPGEASALAGVPVAEIEADRVGHARRLAQRYGAVVVLKGAPTVVADADRYWINTTGGPVLSQGGTGDVLAGAAAGLLAQGLEPRAAACCAVYLHGLAGDLCAAGLGSRGVLAGEVAGALPRALEQTLRGEGSPGPVSSIREVFGP